MATYVVSDIHGNLDTFEKGLKTINFSDNDFLWVLGDSVDRGPDGIKLLQKIKDTHNIDTLIGNHELFLLECVEPNGEDFCTGDDTSLWLNYNGGRTTFNSYKELSKEERIELLKFLKSRKLITRININNKNYILTHSYYMPDYEEEEYSHIPENHVWDIVWNSPYRNDTWCDINTTYGIYEDLTFLSGHVPVQVISGDYRKDPVPNIEKNLYDIDGGLAYDGRDGIKGAAIFIRLDDMKEFIVCKRDLD